jgi:hypothetical protein
MKVCHCKRCDFKPASEINYAHSDIHTNTLHDREAFDLDIVDEVRQMRANPDQKAQSVLPSHL